MGDYYPIELKPKRRSFLSEKLSKSRYYYINGGKEEGIIQYLEFSTLNENTLLSIASKNRFITVDPSVKDEYHSKVESSFNSKYQILATALRSDGKLCAITLENDCIVIDVDSKSTIRRFGKAEEQFTSISFSDDKSKIIFGSNTGKLSIFEVATGERILTIPAHNDVVKCITPLSVESGRLVDDKFSSCDTNDLTYFATCSYDFKISIWRLLTGNRNIELNKTDSKLQLNIIKTLSHNFPVECIGIVGNNILISCGGTSVKIWDLEGSNPSCIKEISNFGRTITSLSLNRDFFVVGCLDHNLYLYECNTYEFIRSFSFSRGVIKVAISKCSTYIAVGLEDGSWIIRRKVRIQNEGIKEEDFTEIRKTYRTGTSRYFKRGREVRADTDDTEININKKSLTKLDKMLRSYSYKKALELALNMSWPHFISLLELLSSRGATHLVARVNFDKITNILKYLSKNIGRCTPQQFLLISELIEHILHENNLIGTTNTNRDIDNTSEISEHIKKISQKISLEAKQHTLLKQIKGAVEIIIQNCKKSLT